MFEIYDQKLVVFAIYGRFHELLPTVLGFQGDLHVWESWPSTRRFCILWQFSWVIAHIFGVPARFEMTTRHDTCLRAWPKTRHFLRFMAVFHELLPIVLGFQGDLKWLEDPIQVWGLIKNLSFSCFMAVFMRYCPHFWGSRGIRMARKTLHMFESYDQKLVVFAFYGRFHELLPIVLGFQGDL